MTTTERPPLGIVRGWFELYLSEQRGIAKSLGLPPQGAESQIEWGKRVLMTAKERDALPYVSNAIAAALAQRS